MLFRRVVLSVLLLGLVPPLAACGNSRPATEEELMNTAELRKARIGKLFGEDTLRFGPGAKDSPSNSGGGGGIAVNGYLWRASLDTMSFMPLSSADPFGGVIITDWYVAPESPSERFKVQIYILDRQLRANGLRVTVFRQERDSFGGWSDAVVNPDTQVELENAILTRARQLRIDSGIEL